MPENLFPAFRLLHDLDHSHHSQVFMIEDMAMVDGLSSKVIKAHAEPAGLTSWHQHHIPPSTFWLASGVQNLEGIGVQVERMVHVTQVNDLPVLYCAQPDLGVDAVMIERAAIDLKSHTFAEHEAPHGQRRWRKRLDGNEPFWKTQNGLSSTFVEHSRQESGTIGTQLATHLAHAASIVRKILEPVDSSFAAPAYENLDPLTGAEENLLNGAGSGQRTAVGSNDIHWMIVEL